MCQSIRKPIISIDFDSPDGNVYFILAKAIRAIRAYDVVNGKEKEQELRERFKQAHDYSDALRIIGEYVIIDVVGGEMP